ncbi:MAG: pSer/pThr/pTyr-binding forkhead associated (FHA) protein [Planctomycetota bacterium]|jgi:pSer/pThr/pTyr-binding forkhead associated (FHA) protein
MVPDSVIRLRLIRPGIPDEEITVKGDCALIGRSIECDVRIDQPYVSKRHFRIFKGYVVVDLESRNGTYIEGVPVSEPTLLDGTRISLGDQDAIVEIVRDESVEGAPRQDRDTEAELDRLRRRNLELTKLVGHLEDELAITRRKSPGMDETMEIRHTAPRPAVPVSSVLKRIDDSSDGPTMEATASLNNSEADAIRQLRNLTRVEAELEEARKKLRELSGE